MREDIHYLRVVVVYIPCVLTPACPHSNYIFYHVL